MNKYILEQESLDNILFLVSMVLSVVIESAIHTLNIGKAVMNNNLGYSAFA